MMKNLLKKFHNNISENLENILNWFYIIGLVITKNDKDSDIVWTQNFM